MSRPSVTAFRGVPTGGPPPRPAGPPPPAPPPPGARPESLLLHPIPARAMAFAALGLFGALHWMQMVEPAAPGRAWAAMLAAALTAGILLGASRLRGPLRAAAIAAGLAAGAAVALLAAGVDGRLLLPTRWDELASGIARGVAGLPGARVPYRGIDEWLRLAIPLGGTMLTVAAAALTFWPRRGSTGFRAAALVALVALYAVPAVALFFEREFLRGALLAILVVAFLRLERLRRRGAPAAGALAGSTVVLALLLAPAFDGIDPWWDYETWALSAAGSRSTAFEWNHDYGPLRWPRDGRELLRVKSPVRTYWKADQLDVFDADRWQRSEASGAEREAPSYLVEGVELRNERRWTSDIRVSVRNLRTETFVAAGSLVEEGVRMPRRAAVATPRAGIFRATRELRRGDTYTARVYVPQPSDAQLRQASANYSAFEVDRYTKVIADPFDGLDFGGPDRFVLAFPAFGSDPRAELSGADATGILENSSLARSWELAQRLRRRAASPYEYLRAVERVLSRGYRYSETPPPGSETLDGFLFDTRVGFCQQFSGAMALLLRLGGIPARIATGFSPGSLDEDTDEFVVRDYDAHSWVEAWFSGIGWVTFDPTPTTAPPRSQATDDETSASAAIGDTSDIGTATFDPRRDGPAAETSRPWGLYGALTALLIAGGFFARELRRRRHRAVPAGDFELARALRIVGSAPVTGLTLSSLEDRFAAVPAAAGYVRAVRASRYAGAPAVPTPAQRRGLRRALADGGGLRGRLRAWRALPPRVGRRRPRADLH